ncbi:hypothetical protein Hypma_004646, partial [Hypsizygus marmoreus]
AVKRLRKRQLRLNAANSDEEEEDHTLSSFPGRPSIEYRVAWLTRSRTTTPTPAKQSAASNSGRQSIGSTPAAASTSKAKPSGTSSSSLFQREPHTLPPPDASRLGKLPSNGRSSETHLSPAPRTRIEFETRRCA